MKTSQLVGGAILAVGVVAMALSGEPARTPVTLELGERYRIMARIRPALPAAEGLGLKSGAEAAGLQNVVVDFTAAAETVLEYDQLTVVQTVVVPGVSSISVQGHTLTIVRVEPLP